MAFNINAQVVLSGPKNLGKIKQTIQKSLGGSIPVNITFDPKAATNLAAFNKQLSSATSGLQKITQATNAFGTALKTVNSNTASVVSGIQKINNAAAKTSSSLAQATNQMQLFGKDAALAVRRFSAFTIATGAIYGFVRSIQQATKEAIEFQREMNRLKIVSDGTDSQIKDFQNTVDQLSTSLGLSSNEIAKIGVTIAQSGRKMNEVKSIVAAIAKASLTPSFGDMEDTAEGVIAVLEQFQISANRTEAVLGSLNAVSKAFAVESSDLIATIRKTGGVFATASADLSKPEEALADLLGIFTSVRATTRESAETIATGLRTIFSRLQRRSTIEFLKQFQIDLVDTEGKFVGFFESFRKLSEGLGGIQKAGDVLTIAKIVEELGGIRQVGKLIPAIQQFTKAEQARKVALEGTGSMTRDVAAATETLSVKIQQLQQRFTKLIRDIADSSTFRDLSKFALDTANAFITMADSLRPLIPLLTSLAAIKLGGAAFDFGKGFIGGIKKKYDGGPIHKFARGGLVPGQGNQDSVNAMLTPGEYVIKKSSVEKLGTGYLNSINSGKRRYATAGHVGQMSISEMKKYKEVQGLNWLTKKQKGVNGWQDSDRLNIRYKTTEIDPSAASKNDRVQYYHGIKSRGGKSQIIGGVNLTPNEIKGNAFESMSLQAASSMTKGKVRLTGKNDALDLSGAIRGESKSSKNFGLKQLTGVSLASLIAKTFNSIEPSSYTVNDKYRGKFTPNIDQAWASKRSIQLFVDKLRNFNYNQASDKTIRQKLGITPKDYTNWLATTNNISALSTNPSLLRYAGGGILPSVPNYGFAGFTPKGSDQPPKSITTYTFTLAEILGAKKLEEGKTRELQRYRKTFEEEGKMSVAMARSVFASKGENLSAYTKSDKLVSPSLGKTQSVKIYSRGLSAKAKSRGEFLVSGVKHLANRLGERLFKNFKVGDAFKPVDFVANQESVIGSILETALNTLAEEKEQLKILDYSGKVENQRLFDFPGGLAAIGLRGMPVEVKKDITKKDAKSSLNKKIKADLARRIVSMEDRPLPGAGISKQEYEKSISEIISARKAAGNTNFAAPKVKGTVSYGASFNVGKESFSIDSQGYLSKADKAGNMQRFSEGSGDLGTRAMKQYLASIGVSVPKLTAGSSDADRARVSAILDEYFEKDSYSVETYGGKGSRSFRTYKLKKADGGGVGTDTVPALLTPGEFVINRESARAIGYSNLARMNKHGKAAGGAIQKFANGGIVQAFADGGGIQPLPKTAGEKFSSIGRGVSQSMFLFPMLLSSLNSGVEGFGVALSTLIVLINDARAAYAANMQALAMQTAAIKKSNTEYKAAVAAGSTYRESRFNVFDRNDPYMKNRKDKFGNILSRTPFNMGGKFVSTFDVNQKARQDAFNYKKLQAEEFNKAQQARANRDYAAAATADAAAKQARDARLEAINRRRAARDRSELRIGSRGGSEYLGYANKVFTYDQNARDPATGRFAPRWTESTVAGSQYRGLNPAPLTFGQRISRGYQNIMGPIQNPSQMLKSFQLSNFSLNPLLYSQLAGSMVAVGAQAAGQKQISGYSGFSGAGAGLKSAAFGGLSGTITGAGFGAMAGSFFGVPGQVAGGVIGGVVGGLVGLANALKNQAMYSSLEKLQMAAKKAADSLQNINPRVGSTYGFAALNTQELSRSLTQAIDSAIFVQSSSNRNPAGVVVGGVTGYINQDNIRAAYEQIDQQTIQSAQETFSRIRDEILGLLPPEQLANFVGLENDLQGFYSALNALQTDPNFQANISTEQRNKLGQQIRALQESRNLVTLGNMENVFQKFAVLEQSQRGVAGIQTASSIRTSITAENLLKNISTGMDIKKAAGEALKGVLDLDQLNQLGANIYDPQMLLQYADANENLNEQQKSLIISLATFAQNSSGAGVALYAQNQLQEQQNRLLALSNARVNAFATALNKLQTIFTRATNDLSVFGDNFDQNIARITQGTQGISMPKNVNVFSDLSGRSTSEIAKSLQDLNRGFLGGRLAIEGIPELLTVQEKLPQLFQQFINDVEIARGQGRGESLQGTTQLVSEFISSYGSQLGLSALPKEFQDLFERTLTNVLNAASRQDTDEKNIGLDALRQELITNFETNFENFGAQADKARAIFERLTESSNKLEENFLKLSAASLESSKGQKEAGLAIQERFARFAALSPNADERTLAFGNFNTRLNTILNQGRIGGGNRMLSMDLVRERGLLIQERKQLESERQQMPNRIDSPEAERNRQALERNEDALRRVEEAINYATGETERLSSIQNKLASIEESRLDSRQKLSAFLNQLSGARNPMEAQRAIQEYFQPAIAAQQIQAFGGTSLPNLASLYQSLLEGPTGIAARYMGGAGGPLNAQSIDRYLAGTTQFLLPGLADIVGQSVGNLGFGQRAVGTVFGPGAYTAMGTPEQQQLVGQYGAILASQSKMLQDNANLNSQLLLDQQDVYRKSIETTNQIIASAIQQYQNLLNNPIPGARGLDQTISLLNDSINKLNESINRLNQINNPDLSPGAKFEKLQPLVEKIIFGAVNGAFGQKGEYKAFGGVIGGPKGTDTVPAWLTPGEFVMKKSSAEKIGYSNLQRMNAGYYQDGGIVGEANKESAFGFNIYRTGIQGENSMRIAMQNILPAFAGKTVAEADQMVNLDRYAMKSIKDFRNQLNKLVGDAYLDNLVDSTKVPRNNIDPKSLINNFGSFQPQSLLKSFGYFENISSYFKDLYDKINPLAYTDVGTALREFSKYVFDSKEHPGTERQFFTKRLGETINDYYFRAEREFMDEALAAKEDIVAANPKPTTGPRPTAPKPAAPKPAAPKPAAPKPAAPPPAPAAGVSKDKSETLAEKIAVGAATGAVIGQKGAKKLEIDARKKARFERQRQRNREDQAVAAKEAVEDLFQSPQISDIYEKAGIKDELNTINSTMDFGDWTGAAETRLATALQSPSDQTFGPFNRVDYQKANYMIGRDKYIYAGKFLEIPPQPNETREQKQARIQANNKIQAEVSKRFKNRSTIRAKNKYVKDIVDLVTKNSDLQPDLAEMLGKPVDMATLATDLQSISNPEIVKTYQELVNLNVERRRPERIDNWIKSRGISDPVAAAKIKEQILKNQSLDTSWDDIAEKVYFTPERVKKAEAQARAFKEKKKRELLGEDVVPNQDSNFYEGQMGIPSGVPQAGRALIASAEEARKELNDINRWPPFFNKIGKRLQDIAAYSQTQDKMSAALGQPNQYQEVIADQNAISVGVRILNNPWMAASEFVVGDPALRNEFNALRNGDTPESAEFRRFLARQYDLNRAAHGLDLTEEMYNKIQDERYGVNDPTSQGRRRDAFIRKATGGVVPSYLNDGGHPGGPMGTDIIPAWLTPGEFVVKKDSAQKIGYSNLHRMNRTGYLAKGGIVDENLVGKTSQELKELNKKPENPLGLISDVTKAPNLPNKDTFRFYAWEGRPEQKPQQPQQPQQPQDPPPCPSCPDIIDAQTKMTTVQKRALKNWCGRKDAYAEGPNNRFTVLDKISMRMRGYVPGYDPLTNTLMYPGIKGRNIHPRWNNGVNPFEAESQERFLNKQLDSINQQEKFLSAQLMQQMSPEQFQQVKARFDAVKSMKEQLSEMLENVKNKNGCGDAAAAMAAAGNANQFFGKKGRGKRVRYNERPDVIQKRKERLEKEQKAGAELAMKELFTDQQIVDIYKSVDLKGRDPNKLAGDAIAKAKQETDPKMIFAGKFLELPIPANASKEEQSDIRKINGSIMAAVSRRRKELSDSKTQRKIEGEMMGMVGGPYLASDLATAEREAVAYREQNVQVKSLERFNSYLDSFDVPKDETLRKQIKEAVDKGMDMDKAMDRFYFTPQRVDKYVAQARAFKAGKKAALLGENIGPVQDEEWNFYKGQMGIPSGVPQAGRALIASAEEAKQRLNDTTRWPPFFNKISKRLKDLTAYSQTQDQMNAVLGQRNQYQETIAGQNAISFGVRFSNNPWMAASEFVVGDPALRNEFNSLRNGDSPESVEFRRFLAKQYDLNRAAHGIDLTEEMYNKIQDERYGINDPTSQGIRRKYASGGMVYGPSGTDQIPARLTSGEYVLNKGATYALGGKVLDYMNQTGKLPVYRATGGPIGNVPNGMSGAGSGNFNFQVDFSQSIADFSKQINGVFTTAGDRFVNKINPLMASMQTLVQKLESLPAIQLQLDAKIGPVEVILNAGGLGSIITREVMTQVADQVHKKLTEYGLVRNASGGLPNQMK